MTVLLIVAVLWLAYSNGANDNFKGVATLYGSGAATFGRAMGYATVCTVAGSLVSILLASTLAKQFTGSGLVSAELAQSSVLLMSVGAAGAATVLLATVLGMPTSTTHALTGALVGVALVANGGSVQLAPLWAGFFRPLLISPVLAVALAAVLYLIFRQARQALGVTRETCVCVGPERQLVPVLVQAKGMADASPCCGPSGIEVMVGETTQCVDQYCGQVAGVNAHSVVNAAHFASAGAVCFARAVNDTPKIAALLMIGGAISGGKLALVAVAMAVGGLLQARRVAETMSNRITTLNPGQGLTSNLVTSLLVIGASRIGVPVSTTHVSVGSIFGIGLVGGETGWKTVGQIALAWVTTLPVGGLIGAALYSLLGAYQP